MIKKWLKRILKFSLLGLVLSGLALWIALALLPKPPLLEEVPFSRAFYDRNGHLLRLVLSPDEKYRLYLPLSAVSPHLIQAALLHEDRFFRYHPGVNPLSLLKALWKTYISHDFTMGASTLTMQVVRLRSNLHTRSFWGKITQLFKALQLEYHYSKDEILEAYFNLAPYGQNIEGIGAASLIYFQKRASELSLPEVLLLTVIPQNPVKRNINHPAELPIIQQAQKRLFSRWVKEHPADLAKKGDFELPLVIQERSQLPSLTPHFIDGLLQDEPIGQGEVTTTIYLELQKKWEKTVERYLEFHRSRGIENAAALLLHYPSMEVRALIGSANYSRVEIEGQVNGSRAKRSPGSALKPFIYALALDQGLIHPQTLLKDTPKSFGAYNPENFDGKFFGPVHATEALNQSRNVPAVTLSSQLIHPNLYEFLQQADISKMKKESFYGLSPALGGLEVSMEELARLYAILGNQGKHKPIRMKMSDPYAQGHQMLSPEASFLIKEMMRQNPRPSAQSGPPVPIAWKTGTSFAYRDAWSAGIVGPYVVLVWVGNFDGKGNPEFTGRFAAAPLMFQLMENLESKELVDPFPKTEKLNVTQVEVCTNSGFLASSVCSNQTKTWFIPGVSPILKDEINQEIAIDTRTSLRSCDPFSPFTKFEVYEFWPSDLQKLFQKAGVPRKEPPAFHKECSLLEQSSSGKAPEITSPVTKVKYVTRIDSPKQEEQTAPFIAVTDAGVKTVYWFVDTQFVGRSKPNEALLWKLIPGKFVLRAVDDHGRATSMNLEVIAQ